MFYGQLRQAPEELSCAVHDTLHHSSVNISIESNKLSAASWSAIIIRSVGTRKQGTRYSRMSCCNGLADLPKRRLPFWSKVAVIASSRDDSTASSCCDRSIVTLSTWEGSCVWERYSHSMIPCLSWTFSIPSSTSKCPYKRSMTVKSAEVTFFAVSAGTCWPFRLRFILRARMHEFQKIIGEVVPLTETIFLIGKPQSEGYCLTTVCTSMNVHKTHPKP